MTWSTPEPSWRPCPLWVTSDDEGSVRRVTAPGAARGRGRPSTAILQPEMARRAAALPEVLERDRGHAAPPVVAVGNPGCAIQIAAGLREIGSSVEVRHPAELVAPGP